MNEADDNKGVYETKAQEEERIDKGTEVKKDGSHGNLCDLFYLLDLRISFRPTDKKIDK